MRTKSPCMPFIQIRQLLNLTTFAPFLSFLNTAVCPPSPQIRILSCITSIHSRQPGNTHWFNTAIQLIDTIQILPSVLIMALFLPSVGSDLQAYIAFPCLLRVLQSRIFSLFLSLTPLTVLKGQGLSFYEVTLTWLYPVSSRPEPGRAHAAGAPWKRHCALLGAQRSEAQWQTYVCSQKSLAGPGSAVQSRPRYCRKLLKTIQSRDLWDSKS